MFENNFQDLSNTFFLMEISTIKNNNALFKGI